MKKSLLLLVAFLVSLGVKAQFEQGTHYVNASLSGFGVGFSQGRFNMGVSGECGYFVKDGWMLGGSVGYKYSGASSFYLKPSFRYSFVENGLNLGCGIQYEYAGMRSHYIQFCPQVGYTFFLGKNISLEPSLYADFALNDFRNGTNAGLKIGIGLYRGK